MASYTGTSGDDIFTGGAENDSASGGGGNDSLAGGAGADTLDGGAGNDWLYSTSPDAVAAGPYTLSGMDLGWEPDDLRGGDGSDRLFAGYGDNVDGGGQGSAGDWLFLSLQGAPSGVTADFRQSTLTIGGGVITNIEDVAYLQGSQFDDNLTLPLNGSNNGPLTDLLGMDGNDTLTGGLAVGRLLGGSGNDLLDARYAAHLSVVDGGSGNDTIILPYANFASVTGGDGDDTISGGTGQIHGGAGDDVIDVPNGNDALVYGEDGNDRVTSDAPFSTLIGGAGADTLTGGDIEDALFSAGGRVAGVAIPDPDLGLEHDVLSGLNGNDYIAIGYGDEADGGTGIDYLALSLGGADHGLALDTGNIVSGGPLRLGGGVIQNFEQIASLRGSEFDDNFDIADQSYTAEIDGAGGNDVIRGHASSISVSGGAGADRFVSSTANDTFDGGAGSDTVDYSGASAGVTVNLSAGSGGGDTLIDVENATGSAFADTLTGTGGSNLLQGGDGDDRIDGGPTDTLTGGAGADTFAFSTHSSSNVYVTDFAVGTDRIDISSLLRDAGYTGSDPMRDGYLRVFADKSDGAFVTFVPTPDYSGASWLYLDLQHVSPTDLTWEKLNGGPTPGQPTIAFNMVAMGHAEGDAGATNYSWTVTRAGDTSAASSVHWAVTGTGAHPADGADFVGGALPFGDLTFAAGETAKTLTVSAAGDTLVEADEQFTVTLSNATNAMIGRSTVQAGITNDDTVAAGRVYTADHIRSTVVGGGGDDTINASEAGDTLTGGAGSDLFHFGTKPWEPAHITDFTVGADKLDLSALLQQAGYTGSNPVGDQYISFADNGAGGTKVLFDRDGAATGQQWPDRIIELDNLAYNPANSGQILGTSAGGPAPQATVGFSAAEGMISHNEGNSGWTGYTWTVTRTGDTSGASSVSWSAAGSGASPASTSDLISSQSQGTLTFGAGETSRTLTVFVAGDTVAEADEDFTVTLSAPAGATLGDATRVGRILNDDTAAGGGSGQVFTASQPHSTVTGTSYDDTINGSQAGDTLTGGAGADLFRFASKPWEPTHITDFTVGADKLDLSALLQQAGYTGSNPIGDQYISFADNGAGGTKVLFDRDGAATGQQWPDRILELDNLAYNPANASQMLGTSASSGGGSGPAPTVIALEAKTTTQAEGNSGLSIYSYTLTRSGDLSQMSSVGWRVTGSGANPANAADFENGALPSGNFIFYAGETSKTIFVKVAGDASAESDEQFTVTLSGPSGATLGNATAQGVIANDDAPAGGGGTSGQVYTATDVHSTLTGTAYNDTFNASQAADTITGGAGADLFHFGSKPWEPAHITDFQVGADKLDLSALLQQVGYAGSDPVADQYISFADNGAGGTKVLFDRDGAASGQPWPDRIIELDNLAYSPANSSQILGTSVSGGGSTGGGSTPTTIALEAKTTSQAEGDSGLSIYSYTLTRSGDLSHSSSVGWAVNGSGANPATAADFENGALPSGNFIFAAGEASKTIFVKVAGDTAVESDEQFTVTLSGPSGSTLGNATAQGVITNDDVASGGGSTGAGQVYTSAGPQTVATGTAGNDTFNASQGADTLTGGAGSDVFNLPSEPWSPIHITDFTPGTDKIDLSHLLKAVGYAGTDPVADHYVYVGSDGADGSIIRFDRDGGGPNPQWPNTIIDLEHVAPAQVTSSDWIIG